MCYSHETQEDSGRYSFPQMDWGVVIYTLFFWNSTSKRGFVGCNSIKASPERGYVGYWRSLLKQVFFRTHASIRGVKNFMNFVKDFETFFGTLGFSSGFWYFLGISGFILGFWDFFRDFFEKVLEILGFFWDFGTFFGTYGLFWNFLKMLSKIFSSCSPGIFRDSLLFFGSCTMGVGEGGGVRGRPPHFHDANAGEPCNFWNGNPFYMEENARMKSLELHDF